MKKYGFVFFLFFFSCATEQPRPPQDGPEPTPGGGGSGMEGTLEGNLEGESLGGNLEPGGGREEKPPVNTDVGVPACAGTGTCNGTPYGADAETASDSSSSQDTIPPDTGPVPVCVSDEDCEDFNPCTDDICKLDGACIYGHNTNACDDGISDTVNDVCGQGVCSGEPTPDCVNDSDCEDSNPCTDNICNGGVCEVAVNSQCECQQDSDCTDGNICTDDLCKADHSCGHYNNSHPCNDANPNTINDSCVSGVCQGEVKPDCYVDADCPEDGDPCTDEKCVSGACQSHSSGQCECQQDSDCEDGNACTEDICKSDFACAHVFNSHPCDDANPNTINDHCVNGVCQGMQKVGCQSHAECDDSNPCTDNQCLDGICVTSPNGVCQCQSDAECNDSNECTDDFCKADHKCGHYNNTQSCNDNNPNTINDTCSQGVCEGEPESECSSDSECYDSDPCTTDKCVAGKCVSQDNGVCECQQSSDCNDGNPCTEDVCKFNKTCAHLNLSGVACDDGNSNTINDLCLNGVCQGYAGCTSNSECNDSDPCTTDLCSGGTCIHNNSGQCACQSDTDCNDSNPCTTDFCKADHTCGHINSSNSCDDGNPGTTNDTCVNGVCQGQAQPAGGDQAITCYLPCPGAKTPHIWSGEFPADGVHLSSDTYNTTLCDLCGWSSPFFKFNCREGDDWGGHEQVVPQCTPTGTKTTIAAGNSTVAKVSFSLSCDPCWQ